MGIGKGDLGNIPIQPWRANRPDDVLHYRSRRTGKHQAKHTENTKPNTQCRRQNAVGSDFLLLIYQLKYKDVSYFIE